VRRNFQHSAPHAGRLLREGRNPMLMFRWVVLLLLASGLVCLAMFVGTGESRYRVYGVRIIKWTVIAALGFFAVLILERLAMIL
jgi:hypothetical protein